MILTCVLIVTNKITNKATCHFLNSRVHRERSPSINCRYQQAETVHYHENLNGPVCYSAGCSANLETIRGRTGHKDVATGVPKYCTSYSPCIVQASIPPTGGHHEGI